MIESRHKWTQILFIISNPKLEIYICSQPTIDVNSQSNLYNIIFLDHTRLFTELHLLWSPTNLQNTYSEKIIYLVPPGYGTFVVVLRKFLFLCIHHWQKPITTTTHAQNIQISMMSVPELPSNIYFPEEIFQASIRRVSI